MLGDVRPLARQATAINLAATVHPPVPSELGAMWYAPSQTAVLSPAQANFVRGVALLDVEDNAGAALPLLSQGALADTPLADYARYYTGRALVKLDRWEAAEAAFATVAARRIEGHLPEDAALGQAEAREGRGDFSGALEIYTALLEGRPSVPHVVWFRAASAADRGGDRARAVLAYRRVYYEYPLSAEAEDADTALTRLEAWDEADRRVTVEIARGDALFEGRRWSAARRSYERARPFAGGEERQRVTMRLAACDVALGRYRVAREALRVHLDGPFADEATSHFLTALRGTGAKAEYVQRARAFAAAHPTSPFVEDVLNALATHFIVEDQDESADEVFREILERFPKGRFTERAAWRAGWWAYRQQRFGDAGELFDRGAAAFPRSDYRPSWLYWSARASEQAGAIDRSIARYRLVATDYLNTYYGRLAMARLQSRKATSVAPTLTRAAAGTQADTFPTSDRVTALIATGLHREALNELLYAQRTWGDSPRITATIALVQNRLGNIRPGINAMKRAYPQWMAAGGETLPDEILKIIFPVDYWALLQKHAAARGLDPYLVAALVAQESNFDPEVRSTANAIGLMQILPSTGRAYARRLGIRPFSSARLTNPEINVRIGTTIFSEEVRRYGGVHFALAAYNAGGSRVVAWQRERPDLAQDEFIDDIPFPETQNYVKRILGTAEDYRRLYRSR